MTRKINGEIYTDHCDLSLIGYTDVVVFISSNLSILQAKANLDSLISGCKLLGFIVHASNAKFLAYNALGEAVSSLSVAVAGKFIIESILLKYLILVYGPDKRSTRVLSVENAVSGFCASYAKLGALKYNYSKCIPAKLFSSLPWLCLIRCMFCHFKIRCLKLSS